MSLRNHRPTITTSRLAFNADAAAIIIALVLATLVRFNVFQHITW
jgi:hypothetical protein